MNLDTLLTMPIDLVIIRAYLSEKEGKKNIKKNYSL